MTPALIEPEAFGCSLHDLRPGDHWCELYHHDQEHLALLKTFFADGLAQNHKLLYIAEEEVARAQLDELERAGLGISEAVRRGQLVTASPAAAYLVNGRFDRERMLREWERHCAAARREGYSALRAAGEPTWALRDVPGSEELAQYESQLNDFAATHPCIIFCQYDARRFPAKILLDVLSAHPVAVLDNAVVGNPYFVPPAEARSEQRDAAKLVRWVTYLREQQRRDERRADARPAAAARAVRRLRRSALAAGILAALIALLVLAGYALGIRAWTAFGPGYINARPLAAIGILAAAVALVLQLRPGSASRRIARVAATVVLGLGVVALFEWVSGRSPGLDELLFAARVHQWSPLYPGRISLPTVFGFVLLGAALLLLDWEPRRGRRPAQWSAVVAATISVLALQGYTFGVVTLSSFGLPIAISLPVAISLLLLSLGTLFARPDAGAMRVVTSEHAGGAVLRWALPLALGVTWLLGWASERGLERGFYPSGADQLVFALPLMVLFAFALYGMARILNRAGERQQEQHAELERLNRELETRVEHRTARLVEASAALEAEVVQRRANESELRRLNRAYKALSRCSDAVTRAASEGTLLQEVCELAVQVGGYRLVWVGYAQDDEQKSVLPMAYAGEGADYVCNVRITWADTERGRGPTGVAIRTGEPCFIADTATAPGFEPWRDAALARGYHSVMTAPLKEGDRAFGTLNFYAAEPDAFDVEERGLVVELASTLSHAVLALRARAERDRATAETRALNATLEHRVEERTAALAATNQELEAFTYSVAHDLRTPLRHVHGFVTLLAEDYAPQLDDTAREYIQHIVRGSQQMGQLIDDLLNLSRVGRQQLVPQVVGLNRLVDDVRAQLAADAGQRRVTWRVGELPFVECDAALIRQVFQNLLANALKFTRPRAEAVIEVGRMDRGGETVLFVRDNGVGFNMKYADKLFGVFQRLHRAEDFEGTGVGLVTVQRILHKHGGRIWAEAELDRGATFYFTLGTPLEPPPVREAAGESHATTSR